MSSMASDGKRRQHKPEQRPQTLWSLIYKYLLAQHGSGQHSQHHGHSQPRFDIAVSLAGVKQVGQWCKVGALRATVDRVFEGERSATV